jgi:hypothetical protein
MPKPEIIKSLLTILSKIRAAESLRGRKNGHTSANLLRASVTPPQRTWFVRIFNGDRNGGFGGAHPRIRHDWLMHHGIEFQSCVANACGLLRTVVKGTRGLLQNRFQTFFKTSGSLYSHGFQIPISSFAFKTRLAGELCSRLRPVATEDSGSGDRLDLHMLSHFYRS